MKKYTREQKMRNRRIVEIVSLIFALVGMISVFIFAGTRIECELPWGIGIAGVICLLVSYGGFHLLETTNGKKRG